MPVRQLSMSIVMMIAVVLLAACVSDPRPRADTRQDGSTWRGGHLVRGKQTGMWTYWYPGGQQQASGRFDKDKQDGQWTYWYANGQMQSTGSYAGSGQRVGAWAYWYDTGKRQAQGAYGTVTSGEPAPGAGRADRQHGLWRFYRVDGALAASGSFINGSRMLVWSYYAADGSLAEQGAYWNGSKIGLWREAKEGALAWVDHGCPEGYACYREPSDGAPRRWGMLKDQRPTGLWIVYGENGSPAYADVTQGSIVEWTAWRPEGQVLASGQRGATPFVQYFTATGLAMVASAAGSTAAPGQETIDELAARIAADERRARAELVTTIAAAPVASTAPLAKPAALADVSLAPTAALPGLWTPKEEGSVVDLIKSYTSMAARAASTYNWEPVGKPGGKRADLIGKMLPQTRLLSADGDVIDLADSQGQEKVVVVVLRGFSGQVCLYCSTQTAALIDSLPRFSAKGARVVLVYPGTAEAVPQFIQAVRTLGREVPPDITVAIDPDLNMVRGLGIEDAMAKPTSVILDKQGAVAWVYVGANMTDRPAVDTLLTEVSRLP